MRVLIAVLLAATVSLSAVYRAEAGNAEVAQQSDVHVEWTWGELRAKLLGVVWMTLLWLGKGVTWGLYGDDITEGARRLVTLTRDRWEQFAILITEKTGQVCRLARASDGEWVAMCES